MPASRDLANLGDSFVGTTINVNFDSDTLVIDGVNNRVGMGTASPSSPLHVVGDTRTTSINSGPLAGFRNAIINGNFDFWQRATTFSNPASGAYTSDRWLIQFDGTGATRTISRQVFTLGQTDVPGEPTAFYRFNQSVAGSNGTFNTITQTIESVKTFAGEQATVSFYAKASAAITLQEISFTQFFGTGGSPSSSTQTAAASNISVGTTYAKYEFTATFPSISGKVLGTNNNDSIRVDIRLPLNTTFIFDLASVQIELGPVATPFERRPLGTELALCQRYFEKSYADNAFPGSAPGSGNATYNSGGENTAMTYPFNVRKRTGPTMVIFDGAGTAARVSFFNGAWLGGGAITVSAGYQSGFFLQTNIAGSFQVNFEYTASAEL